MASVAHFESKTSPKRREKVIRDIKEAGDIAVFFAVLGYSVLKNKFTRKDQIQKTKSV